MPQVHIPHPCPANWDTMTPTGAGRYCATCQTEVVDFTRLTEAEMLAYLAARPGQRVCAAMQVPVVPQHPKRPKGLRRWLLVLAAVVGGPRLAAWAELPPVPLMAVRLPFLQPGSAERVVVRGTVLDDSLNVPVRGIYIFISGTKYGAITDERGEFILSLPVDWAPIRAGEVLLDIKGVSFALQGQLMAVKITNNLAPLTIRLRSVPKRGFYRGRAVMLEPPVALPGSNVK